MISYIAKMRYESILDKLKKRLNTINTKQKRFKHKEEIIVLKMIITLLINLLDKEHREKE